MHQIDSNAVPTIFFEQISKAQLNYPTNFARTNYSTPYFKLNKSKCQISIWVPTLWRHVSNDTEKNQQKTFVFKTIMKNKLLAIENELIYF